MKDKSLTFEVAMTRLEQIVVDLEGGTLSLEESLKKFEEGIALGKTCRAFLDRADVRIRTLTATTDSSVPNDDGAPDPSGADPDDDD